MLNATQIEKVRLLLASSGWNDVVRPAVANRANEALKQLILSPSERQGEYKGVPDDVLRARIQEAEWMLACWGNEVKVFDFNRQQEELQSRENGAQAPQPAENL